MSLFTGFVSNSNLVVLSNLKDNDTGDFVNDASVSCDGVFHRKTGALVTGETFPKSMLYQANSDGTYTVSLSPSLALVPGTEYFARITAIVSGQDSDGETLQMDVVFTAKNREAGVC